MTMRARGVRVAFSGISELFSALFAITRDDGAAEEEAAAFLFIKVSFNGTNAAAAAIIR